LPKHRDAASSSPPPLPTSPHIAGNRTHDSDVLSGRPSPPHHGGDRNRDSDVLSGRPSPPPHGGDRNHESGTELGLSLQPPHGDVSAPPLASVPRVSAPAPTAPSVPAPTAPSAPAPTAPSAPAPTAPSAPAHTARVTPPSASAVAAATNARDDSRHERPTYLRPLPAQLAPSSSNNDLVLRKHFKKPKTPAANGSAAIEEEDVGMADGFAFTSAVVHHQFLSVESITLSALSCDQIQYAKQIMFHVTRRFRY
jgi:hypothetical protein